MESCTIKLVGKATQHESAGNRPEGVDKPFAGDTDNAKKASSKSGTETPMQTMQAHNDVVHVQKARCDVVWNMVAGSAELKLEITRHDGVYTVLHIMEARRPWSRTQAAQARDGYQEDCGEITTMEQEGMKGNRLQTAAGSTAW